MLLTIILSWITCYLLTVYDVFEPNSAARTDINQKILHETSWFRIPYPFQFGLPTFSVEGIFGMLAGVLSAMIESIGDYYACARLSGT